MRFEDRDLPYLAVLPFRPVAGFPMMVGLPAEPRKEMLARAPLHLQYAFDRPGIYEVRYTDTVSGGREGHMREPAEWTRIEVKLSTLTQRRTWFQKVLAGKPNDTTELLAGFLPSILATRDEEALRIVAEYLDSPDAVLKQHASYALHYSDPVRLARIVPGRQPLRGIVR